METQNNKRKERIDIRVTPEEKQLFLKALKLNGDRSLSAFITRVIKNKSFEILERENRILASERDKEIFFNTIFNEQEPNQVLKDAAKKFESSQD